MKKFLWVLEKNLALLFQKREEKIESEREKAKLRREKPKSQWCLPVEILPITDMWKKWLSKKARKKSFDHPINIEK